jgi:hypothetical protein
VGYKLIRQQVVATAISGCRKQKMRQRLRRAARTNATISKWLADVTRRRNKNGRYTYSEESPDQLRLVAELTAGYHLIHKEVRETFRKVPIEEVQRRVGRDAPHVLYKFLRRKGVQLRESLI